MPKRIVRLPEFTEWHDALASHDSVTGAIIAAGIKKLAFGLGDVKSIGDQVSELRVHTGGGWRIYFTERGGDLVILLVGGPKKSQARDIAQAKKLVGMLD